jgi:predicted nucleotidyltransferase
MNREKAIKLEIQQQLQKVGSDLEGYRVILFGSQAAGCAGPHSDFDVGIIGEHPISLTTFYRIGDIFEAIDTLYTIDWVDLNRVTPAFRREAMETVEVLYEG